MEFSEFAKQMRERAERLPQAVNEVKKDVASAVVKTLVEVTPVDTSAALSNYQIGINAPARATLPPRVAGKRGSTAAASSDQTIAAAETEIGTALPGDEIYISNNIDYIQDLDDGTSPQAPSGMKDIALAAGREVLEGAKLLGE